MGIELQETVRSTTLPPPAMGWNTRDPLPEMSPLYAVEIENYFPKGGTVEIRPGYRYHCKNVGTTGAAGLIAELYYGSTRKMVTSLYDSAARVYDVTNSGSSPTNITAGSLTQAMSYFQQFKDRLFMSNGTEEVYRWTGSGNIASASFTPSHAAGCMTVYKRRFYWIDITNNSIQYGDIAAVTGACTEYNPQEYLKKGGKFLYIGTFSRTKQFLEDELFCTITDQGEVFIFQGDWPGDSTWSIVGQYQIPVPRNNKSFIKKEGDVLIITDLGVISLRAVAAGEPTFYITDIITEGFKELMLTYPSGAVQGFYYPRGQMLIINIEIASETFIQVVQNVTSGAWTKFTGIRAYGWGLFNNEAYFGGPSNKVFKFDNGYFDENPAVDAAVQNRTTVLRPAYYHFGSPEMIKHFQMAIPTIWESEGLNLTIDADVDYSDTSPGSTITDTSDTSYKLYQPTCTLTGVGTHASIRLEQTISTKRRVLQATKVLWTEGGSM